MATVKGYEITLTEEQAAYLEKESKARKKKPAELAMEMLEKAFLVEKREKALMKLLAVGGKLAVESVDDSEIKKRVTRKK